jgi:hypothetical protein
VLVSASEARGLISMGLEVDADSDDVMGTLASTPLLALIGQIDLDKGLLEILASLASAAVGAADVHEGASVQEGETGYEDVCARLKRFAVHIEAARKEIA